MNFYFLKRCILHIKKKGLFSFVKNSINHILYILNPTKIGELPFSYLFKKKRILNKNFIKKNLLKFDTPSIERYFNYYLDTSKIEANPIVYGFGIGDQIGFEESIAKKYKNSNIFCYDPTSNKFIEQYSGPKNIKLFPLGIWKKDEKIKFFHNSADSGSITNYFESKNSNIIEHQCYKLKTFMEMNNHSKIDILKMDIEGVAIEVFENILDDHIFPTQIAAEFEFSMRDKLSKIQEDEFYLFEAKLFKLLNRMKSLNYKCYNNPRVTKPYASIEILFVKQE